MKTQSGRNETCRYLCTILLTYLIVSLFMGPIFTDSFNIAESFTCKAVWYCFVYALVDSSLALLGLAVLLALTLIVSLYKAVKKKRLAFLGPMLVQLVSLTICVRNYLVWEPFRDSNGIIAVIFSFITFISFVCGVFFDIAEIRVMVQNKSRKIEDG